MDAITRKELLLAAIASGQIPDLTPITREEIFLYKIATRGLTGGNVQIEVGTDSGVDVTAQPGQMILVKAVDENGKPTEWEAVDRTHWVEDGGSVEILPETTMATGDDGTIAPTFFVEGDQEITVKWNGTEYACRTYWLSMDAENDTVMFGNSEFLASNGITVETNEAPFVGLLAVDGSISGLIALDGSTEVTVSIYQGGETVHKLDNKFLDLDWLPTVETTEVQLAAEKTVTDNIGVGSITDTKGGFPDLTINDVYDGMELVLYVDGVRYEGIVESIDGTTLAMFGDAPIGLQFVTAYTQVGNLGSATSYVASVYTVKEVYNKIPEEFLPDTEDSGGNVDLTDEEYAELMALLEEE